MRGSRHHDEVPMAKGSMRKRDIEKMVRVGRFGELIGALKGSDRETMCDILDALVGAGEAAVPALIAALGDREHRVHVVASIALGKIGKPAVLPLVRAFREEDGILRPRIATILVDIGDPALEEMAGALRNPDEEVRALSALALGEMRSSRAMDHLIIALGDGSERVRVQAAISLGELGAPGAEEALARAAEGDESPAVRQVAGNALMRVRAVKEDRAAPR